MIKSEFKTKGTLFCSLCGIDLVSGEYATRLSHKEVERQLLIRLKRKINELWDGHECIGCHLGDAYVKEYMRKSNKAKKNA